MAFMPAVILWAAWEEAERWDRACGCSVHRGVKLGFAVHVSNEFPRVIPVPRVTAN
jgi:hypothetical protein